MKSRVWKKLEDLGIDFFSISLPYEQKNIVKEISNIDGDRLKLVLMVAKEHDFDDPLKVNVCPGLFDPKTKKFYYVNDFGYIKEDLNQNSNFEILEDDFDEIILFSKEYFEWLKEKWEEFSKKWEEKKIEKYKRYYND